MAVQGSPIPAERIEGRIHLLGGQKVVLSTDRAELYGGEPRLLVQAVKRNRDHFPAEFLGPLTRPEFAALKSQIVISGYISHGATNPRKGLHPRVPPWRTKRRRGPLCRAVPPGGRGSLRDFTPGTGGPSLGT